MSVELPASHSFIRSHHHHEDAPTRVWALAVMNLAGAVTCAVPGWIAPIPHAHHDLYRFAALFAVAVGVVLLCMGSHLPDWAQQLLLAAYSLMIAVLALFAVRDVSVVALGPAVIVVAAYAGYFCRTKMMYVQIVWGLLLYVVGSTINPAVIVPVGATLSVIVTAAALAVVLHILTQRLRRHTYTDPLTGVASRAVWTQATQRALAAPATHHVQVAIIDLDHFKTVNDQIGHLAGDTLLREISRAWQTQLPRNVLLGRFGGDEFVLLFFDLPDDDVRAALTAMTRAHPAPWSSGLARQQPADSATDLLTRADAQLIEAKKSRRPQPEAGERHRQ